jgi:type VII secretion integral membrane protein EccD
MATATSAGFSRVTIVAPRTRVDLALPTDISFADMLPTLLRHAGDGLADDPAAREGWTLARLGGPPLDTARTPGQLEIRDGEFLYLRPRGAEAPELAFDDVVDAVATATTDRSGRWRQTTTQSFGITLAVIALLAGAVAILFAGPPQFLAGVVGIGAAVGLLLTGVVLSRGFGRSPVGVVFALVGLAYAAVGGLLVGGGDLALHQLGAPHILIAAGVVLVYAVSSIVAVSHGGPVFLSASICAGALLLGTLICFVTGAPAGAGAAGIVAFAFAWLPALPMISYRLARLPIPSIPTGPDDLKTDTETVDGRRVLARSDRADEYLAGLLGALSVLGVGGSVVLAIAGGRPGVLLAAVLGLLMLARARWFISRRQRLPLLISGTATLGLTLVGLYLAAGQVVRLLAIPAILAIVAAVATAFGVSRSERRNSPVAGRMLDILEVLLILAVIPLAAWASGLYGWVRSLNG